MEPQKGTDADETLSAVLGVLSGLPGITINPGSTEEKKPCDMAVEETEVDDEDENDNCDYEHESSNDSACSEDDNDDSASSKDDNVKADEHKPSTMEQVKYTKNKGKNEADKLEIKPESHKEEK
jgi:hypothetical protein